MIENPQLNERVVVRDKSLDVGGLDVFGYITEITFRLPNYSDTVCAVRLEDWRNLTKIYAVRDVHRAYPIGTVVAVNCPLGAIGTITEIRPQNGGYLVQLEEGVFGYGWDEVDPKGSASWGKVWDAAKGFWTNRKPSVWDKIGDPDFMS